MLTWRVFKATVTYAYSNRVFTIYTVIQFCFTKLLYWLHHVHNFIQLPMLCLGSSKYRYFVYVATLIKFKRRAASHIYIKRRVTHYVKSLILCKIHKNFFTFYKALLTVAILQWLVAFSLHSLSTSIASMHLNVEINKDAWCHKKQAA